MVEGVPSSDKNAVINQRIFETTIDLILVCDKRGLLQRVSPSSLLILGYKPEEMVGHLASDFLYPDDLEATREEMRRARHGEVTRHFDCRYVHKSGATVMLTWTGVWSEAEQEHFFIGRDITDARAVEKLDELREMLYGIDQRLVKSASWLRLMRRHDIYVLEGFLLLSSFWATFVLFTPPSNFATFPHAFDLIASLDGHENMWAAFAAVAAIVKFVGLLLTASMPSSGRALRAFGLAMSGLFWTVMGVSTVAGNPDTLFGLPGMLMGVLAWWALLRILP